MCTVSDSSPLFCLVGQGNFYGRRPENSSTGMTSAQMSDLRIKPDFVVEHQRGYKKTLQRRLQMPDEGSGLPGSGGAGEGGMRATLRGSPTIVTREELEDVTHFPEKFNAVQSGASWEGKLLRLIVQKCEEHSGRAVSMRETFLRLDKDKVGWVSKEDLREVLQNYTGMTLSNRCANAISLLALFRVCTLLRCGRPGCARPFLAHMSFAR
jgi:hypothetical protein